ncbi:MAG: histidine triad nucleotide-binding protein [Parcubacteria group bacterium]
MSEKDIFCKMAEGKMPVDKIMETDEWFAINDIHPQAPSHVLLIPKKHIADGLGDLKKEDEETLGRMIRATDEIAQKAGIAKNGYRVIINKGYHGGQTIPHLHIHILGGKKFKEDELVR